MGAEKKYLKAERKRKNTALNTMYFAKLQNVPTLPIKCVSWLT